MPTPQHDTRGWTHDTRSPLLPQGAPAAGFGLLSGAALAQTAPAAVRHGHGAAAAARTTWRKRRSRHLNDGLRAWLLGSAADGHTLQANTNAWAQLRRVLRVLRVLRPRQTSHTRVELLGHALARPIFVAPMAFQALLDPLGELGCALAAASQGAGFVLSAKASQPLEDVAQEAHTLPERGPLWCQLYLQGERGLDADLARRAEAAGDEALVLTVDAPVQGPPARVTLPPGVRAVNLDGAPAPPVGDGPCSGQLARAPTWDDVARLQTQTQPPVLADGGIRRGTDVLKALALGPTAVLVGRPVLQALGEGGPPGAAQVLRLLRDEFEVAPALCGGADPSAVLRGHVVV